MTKPAIFIGLRQHWPSVAAGLVLVAGAALRIWQVYADKSLWLDEIALVRNFSRPVAELLTTPLIFGQVAPRGFVLAEKLSAAVFGWSDVALRLVPLFSGLAALLVFHPIARTICGRRRSLVALTLFSCAAPLVLYSGQAKQYSTETLVALVLLSLVVGSEPESWSWRRACAVGIIGWIAVFFAHTAVFVLAGISGAIALYDGFRRPRSESSKFRPFVLMATIWGAAAVAGVLASIATVHPGTQVFMGRYWTSGFPPQNLADWPATLWPWEPLRQLLRGGDLVSLGYRSPVVCLALLILGGVWIGRRNVRHLLLILGPMAATLAAAALRWYPFSDRLVLFLVPLLLLLLAAGILLVGDVARKLWRPLGAACVLFLTGTGVVPVLKSPPPYWMEDAKPLLAQLASARAPEDAVYVFYGASQAVEYYGARYRLRAGDYFAGDCFRGAPRNYLEELDRFRGRRRVWLILVHAFPPYRERDDIVGYLDAIGVRREYFQTESRWFQRRLDPAELYLFDLSDPARLAQADSATFPIKGQSTVNPRWPCGIHLRPARPSRFDAAMQRLGSGPLAISPSAAAAK